MFRKIAEGDVYANSADGKVVAGSRIAVLPDGKLICSFNEQTKLGSNDYAPMIAYSEDGEHWSEAKYVWPELVGKKCIYGAVRNTLDGRVCIGGFVFPSCSDEDSYWSDEVGGMLENKLIISISDDGYNFPLPTEVELPYYGSAENPGGALVDRDGSISILYAPYKTIEQREEVKLNHICIAKSVDGGNSFKGYSFGEIDAPCQYAESWLVRLSDNCHMISTWQTAVTEGTDQYMLSFDGGETFSEPKVMPFNGQSTALEVWKDGKVFVIYNLRNVEPAGVWLALAQPDENGFNMIANEPVWFAKDATHGDTSGEFDQWTDFAFGEPHIKVLPDGNLLACLWYDQGGKKGIRYVKLALEE